MQTTLSARLTLRGFPTITVVHDTLDYRIGSTYVVCNPRGSPMS
jgi:hypothetical protein